MSKSGFLLPHSVLVKILCQTAVSIKETQRKSGHWHNLNVQGLCGQPLPVILAIPPQLIILHLLSFYYYQRVWISFPVQ